MTAFYKFGRKAWYMAQAQAAARRAEALKGKPAENLWLELAASWKFLAQLLDEPCYCGRPSIGYKIFPSGEKLAVCSQHMRELIVWGILNKMGDRKPN